MGEAVPTHPVVSQNLTCVLDKADVVQTLSLPVVRDNMRVDCCFDAAYPISHVSFLRHEGRRGEGRRDCGGHTGVLRAAAVREPQQPKGEQEGNAQGKVIQIIILLQRMKFRVGTLGLAQTWD